jgi:hypothetical protein
MFAVISVVIILVGSVFAWKTIQDEKVKKAEIALQQKQELDKEKAQQALEQQKKDKLNNEKSYVSNVDTYYQSLHDDYFNKASKLDQSKTVAEEKSEINTVINDANKFINLDTPSQYRSQQNQIIDICNDYKTAEVVAEGQTNPVLMTIKAGGQNGSVIFNDFSKLYNIVEKLPAPAQ